MEDDGLDENAEDKAVRGSCNPRAVSPQPHCVSLCTSQGRTCHCSSALSWQSRQQPGPQEPTSPWSKWIAAGGLFLIATSRGYSSLWGAVFSFQWLLLLWSTGSRAHGSVVVAHRLSCPKDCGIFPDQGSNPCPLCSKAEFLTLGPAGKSLTTSFEAKSLLNVVEG